MVSQPQIKRQTAESAYRPRLHLFTVIFVIATFTLVILGGTVTSKGVGLSVPDWPTTYQYNMFLFPPSLWNGGVFYEHTHRLLGSLVGMLSIAVAVWLWLSQKHRPWLPWVGVGALALVIIQGVMGGLRVTEMSTALAVIHGITAQLFLCLTVLIAAATSRFWSQRRFLEIESPRGAGSLRLLAMLMLAAMLVQLILGATMRHNGAGLAIPDFPTSYGRLVPPLSQTEISAAISRTPYEEIPVYFTPAQVGVHFAHRVWALAVLAMAGWVMARASLAFPNQDAVKRPVLALGALLILQIALGVLVIWTGRHPEVATAHQATGAATLATATLLAIRLHLLCRAPQNGRQRADSPAPAENSSLFLHGANA